MVSVAMFAPCVPDLNVLEIEEARILMNLYMTFPTHLLLPAIN